MNGDRAGAAMDVLLLGGGRWAEAPISLDSATAVFRALREEPRVRVTPALWRRDGQLVLSSPKASEPFSEAAWKDTAPIAGGGFASTLEQWREERGDGTPILFPALHGVDGEDGAIQGLCESIGLAYAFSGVAASAVGMDKIRTRETLAAAGIRCAPGLAFAAPIAVEACVAQVGTELGWPIFAKLASSGSSLGVQRCDSAANLAAFLCEHRLERIVVEAAVVGPEFSVPVLGNTTRNESGELRVLPPIAIRPKNEWFDHEAKYDPTQCIEVVAPSDVAPELLAELKSLAERSHRAVGCDGASRTDFLIGESGPVALEVNTIPGLTEQSLLPQCAAHDGLSFRELLLSLIELGQMRGRSLR